MKREYYKTLYFYELNIRAPLAVFQSSLKKVKSYSLINKIISQLSTNDLDPFLAMLVNTTYDLTRTDVSTLLYNHKFTMSVYDKFRSLDIACETVPLAGVLNYCYYMRKVPSAIFDSANEMFQRSKMSEDEYEELVNLLKKVCYENPNDAELLNYVKTELKDNYLVAVMDVNGRVDGREYSAGDLLLLSSIQIYNMPAEVKLRIALCHMNKEGGMCSVCNSMLKEGEYELPENMLSLIEEALVNDSDFTFHILSHSSKHRSPGMLRILLKQFIRGGSSEIIMRSIGLFEITADIENILISFLKANTTENLIIGLIPHLLKTRKLYFASFVVLFKVFESRNPFVLLVVRNIINRNLEGFESIYDMILEYSNTGIRQSDIDCRVYLESSFRVIAEMFSTHPSIFVAQNIFHIFNIVYGLREWPAEFVSQNIKYVIVQRILDGSYCDRVDDVEVLVGLLFSINNDIKGDVYDTNNNIKSSCINDINTNYNNTNHINTNHINTNYINILNKHFKPSLKEFIRVNLSQLLFKLKSIYTANIYKRKSCMYTILQFILMNIRISDYFNYIWPSVEFFLNKERGICAYGFVEWLRSKHMSPLMVPYMAVPFKNAEDLPVVSGDQLYGVLCRYFQSGMNDNMKGTINDMKSDIKGNINDMKGNINDIHCINNIPTNIHCINNIPTNIQYINNIPTNIHTWMEEESFISQFISTFKSNKIFKSRILQIYPTLPIAVKALLGSLQIDPHTEEITRAPTNLPKAILENFLLKINFEQQDLYSFVIQEFLKNIREPLGVETESFVEQYRYTRYELGGDEQYINTRCDYGGFLVRLFNRLYSVVRGYDYLKYLVLFNTEIVEYACLCLIKISESEYDIMEYINDIEYRDNIEYMNMNDINNIHTQHINNIHTQHIYNITDQRKINQFILKINTFTGKDLIEKNTYLKCALFNRDFYSIVYCLEGTQTERELLQLSYYMIHDYVRVRGLNSVNYNPINLFFELCMEKKFTAAARCIDSIDDTDGMNSIDHIDSVNYMHEIIKCLHEIINSNIKDNVKDNVNSNIKDIIQTHIKKDYQLIRESKNILRTIEIINARRDISDSRESLLLAHRKMARDLQIPDFTKTVELEYIRHLREKKDFEGCTSSITMLILNKDWEVLYEHALVKIEQRNVSEAKELLRKLISIYDNSNSIDDRDSINNTSINSINNKSINSIGDSMNTKSINGINNTSINNTSINSINIHLFKSITKLCELSNSSSLFSGSIAKLERLYDLSNTHVNVTSNTHVNVTSNTHVNVTSNTHMNNIYASLQRLYFLAAKHFERSNISASINFYYKSFNSNYEAIPRFFHILADVHDIQATQSIISSIINNNLSQLIPFYNQISNKLCTPSGFYLQIIKAMLESFPHLLAWDTLILINSKKEDIRRCASSIIESLPFEKRIIFKNTLTVSEQLIKISQCKEKSISMDNFKDLPALLPININIPGKHSKIFAASNDIHVFNSLQCPKKITLIGEDGHSYPLIVKFKDDLRKDSRFMDLDILLNKLFSDSFYIRKYNVIPFTHDSGCIEFIPHLSSLKDICSKYYSNVPETMAKFKRFKRIGGNNMIHFTTMYPPCYLKYLKSTYPSPHCFYLKRENFIKTYAIMCIIGWFMGLGDRHAENIHFDIVTGDTVHVDLNCIFDKGKLLEIPEKVPFRLTQNIIDGFGTIGINGTFKHTLKYTLNLMKINKDVILANLLSFVFDPLFEWAKKKNESKRIIDFLSAKLDFEDDDELIESLIEEATNNNNLGAMYYGWMAFM